MAEAIFLSPLFQVILDNVASLIKEPISTTISTISDAEKNLKKLKKTMLLIDGVLRDAKEKQVKDPAVRNWLRELKDAAFDADDILDEWATEARRSKIQGTPLTLVFLHGIGNKIEEMSERLQEIANERSDFGLKSVDPEKKVEIRETGSFVEKANILGRDDDREKIVNLLVSNEYGQEALSVIPIEGIGGMGKTTLAQYVYNDEQVKKCFEPRMWVCVSEDFDEKSLISRILKSATGEIVESLDLDQLQLRLHEKLSGTRFLLVLDDIWNECDDKWEKIRDILSSCARKSSIIVTTRSEKVSSIMGTTPAIRLKGLSNDDCWSLFKNRAFKEGNEELYPNLIPIGKEIVKKCKGVPLAAKTLGSIMRFKTEENEWLNVSESEIWNLEEENGILNSLKLSYNHLPSHLKRCFGYCAIFPKDYKIEKKKLIQLWMAEGLIQPSMERKEMEDIGNEYFKELLWRSFFQDVRKYDYDFVTCQMHDLIHDLALSIARDDCYIIEDGKQLTIPEKVRYLSMIHDSDVRLNIPDVIYGSKNLRTFLHPAFSYSSHISEVSNSLFVNLTRLRVLDLSGSNIRVLPESVGDLKHLRFLDLSRTRIKSLPESTCNLWNLQTLALRGCSSFSEFPKDMKSMINLRHIEMDSYCRSLRSMPIEIGKLTCLQTLPLFIVGKESGCKIGELHDLKNLRGKISIKNLENVVDMEDAKEANLKNKQHLHSLGLFWNSYINGEVEEGVLESLQPNNKLRDLSIESYRGTKFPTWMMDLSLNNNLEKISLRYCGNCNHLPPFGRLPFLKELRITDMDEIEYLSSDGFYGQGSEETKFPKLEILRLLRMPKLVDWSSRVGGEGKLNHLLELIIRDCPNLRSLPILPSLKKLELYKMDEIKYLSSDGQGNEETEFPKLEILSLEDMPKLVDWSSRVGGEGKLNHLLELYIKGCPNLPSLPILPSLKKLELYKMDAIEYLSSDGFYGQGNEETEFPKLEIVRLEDMPKLVDWSRVGGEGKLNHLLELYIRGCPNLRSLPLLPSCLHKLELCKCEVPIPNFLPHFTNLSSLEIRGFKDLTPFQEGFRQLCALESLTIFDCDELVSMEHLTSLEWLRIIGCANQTSLHLLPNPTKLRFLTISEFVELTSVSEALQNLTALRRLIIRRCPKLILLPEETMQHLTSLEDLWLLDSPNLTCLLEGTQHLTSLKSLCINGCPDLSSLPECVGNLSSSLKRLDIDGCPKLSCLPDTFQHLTTLKCLHIINCPLLKESCKRGGKDWHKISHIPHLGIIE